MDANVSKENATSIFRMESGREDEDSMLIQKSLHASSMLYLRFHKQEDQGI
jgi:hypothetical protein